MIVNTVVKLLIYMIKALPLSLSVFLFFFAFLITFGQ